MAFNVNTNLNSLVAQKNASKTEGALNKAMNRLSSGLRVNGASDDAAGLAIAKNMSKQVTGYEVNVRNANDAVSLLQVAEGGMDEIGNMLQRMKDLALQSSNGTNSADQRANLDLEFQELIAEIDRVVDTTEFNGLNLLNGSSIQNTNFQVDESDGASDKIQVSISDVRSTALSNATSVTIGSNLLADDVFAAGTTLTINYGAAGATDTVTLGANSTVADMINGINSNSSTHGITASLSDNQLILYNSDANAGSITSAAVVDFGGANTDLFDNAGTGVTTDANIGGTTLNAADILTESAANTAISVLDTAITTITSERASIGASQNRFDKAINNLQNKIVNVSAAMGRIMDADFGKETAEFSKQSIVQQAGISMMAQAKSMPQQLLSLLQ
jgi:flagellin